MPFHVSFDDGMIRTKFFGVLTGADLAEYGAELIELERSRPAPPPRFTDLSETTAMNVSFADMAALAERRRGQRFTSSFKSAIIAPSPVQFGLARMFQTLNDHPQVEIRVYREKAEAMAWLRAVDEVTSPA